MYTGIHLNLHLLRIFCSVIEQQSFSRAAESLHISQPAVSKAVRELEAQLGLPLIDRRSGAPRKIALTENGAALLEHARGIFSLERAALHEMQARVELRRGRLIIGASSTVAGYWLPPYLAAFSRQHPEVQLEVHVGNTQAISQALGDCEIDVGLVEGAVSHHLIQVSHWRDEVMTAVAALDADLHADVWDVGALNRKTWLVREPGSGTRSVAEQVMKACGIASERILEFGNNECIARAVAEGVGLAILPVKVVEDLLQLGRVVRLSVPEHVSMSRPLFLLRHTALPLSPLARAWCARLGVA